MLVYIIHDVVVVRNALGILCKKAWRGEGRIEKGEEFHLFGGRGEVGGEGRGVEGKGEI